MDAVCLADLDELEPGFSVPGKKFSGICASQLHFSEMIDYLKSLHL